MNDAYDQEVADLIAQEKDRQAAGLELIPSENYVSQQVLAALGSVFTNKYSEGYPGRRYYGGQEFTDKVEQLAIDRAKQLFNADHANVQPHSGASANEAVYSAWLEPGDTVLAMDLSHGGHLTHGAPVTRSAKTYNFIRYKMKNVETGEIHYDELRQLAIEHKPKIILAGFSAYPRTLDYAKFATIGKEVNALLMADMAHVAGLIAAKTHPNPLDAGFHVMTTTTHKTLRGPRGGLILSKGTVNNPLKVPEKTLQNIPTLIDRAVFPSMQGGPHMNTIAAKAAALHEAMQPGFVDYAKQVLDNAKALAGALSDRGVELITGGTENHLMIIDVNKSFGINGKEAQEILESIKITTNANTIPDDPLPPFAPSGLRLGTPAVTTRGLKEEDMQQVADIIVMALSERGNQEVFDNLERRVRELASR